MGMFKISFTFVVVLLMSSCAFAQDRQGLQSCLLLNEVTNVTISSSSSSSAYTSLLEFSVQNLRFTETQVHRPYVVIIPQNRQQVLKSVRCCLKYGWEIRVRSGGHSYEGLSSTSEALNFALIDLMNFDGVTVDMKTKTAMMDAGATLGQLYATIADKTDEYGFPAGSCPTMGTGGHFSGGGISLLTRKYGLAADNIIDAEIVDARGRLLDRKGMGEDLFWALRGGGGGSWGVVIAWRVQLVKVPRNVTVFSVDRSGRDQVTNLVYRWQSIAPFLEKDLFLRAAISSTTVTFDGMYLGPPDQLLQSVNKSFPEMCMAAGDCKQMSWIDSIPYISYSKKSDLRNRNNPRKNYFKGKSDYVRSPIPLSGLRGAWKFLDEERHGYLLFDPLGGRMDEILASESPFPHRKGNLYSIQYQVSWENSSQDAHYLDWMRRFYTYMTPYVSKSPRAAYVNYVDLDLGTAANGTATVEEARAWGERYFGSNFNRLVAIKSMFDPCNVFRNAQSIPVNK